MRLYNMAQYQTRHLRFVFTFSIVALGYLSTSVQALSHRTDCFTAKLRLGHTIGWNDLAGTADKTELKAVDEGPTDPVPSAKAIAQHCRETRDMSRPAHGTDTRKRQPVKPAPVLNALMMHHVVRWLQELLVAGWHGPRKVGEMRGDEGR